MHFCPYRAWRDATVHTGCRFACPGLCATLGFQPALAKSETWVCYHFVMVRKDRCAKVNVSWRYFSIRNYYLRILCFMFHFLSLMCWFSIIIRGETYSFDVSFYVSCFTFQNTEGAICLSHCVFESLPQCFWISPSVFLDLSLSVFESLPQCFLKMKHWNEKWNIGVLCFIT